MSDSHPISDETFHEPNGRVQTIQAFRYVALSLTLLAGSSGFATGQEIDRSRLDSAASEFRKETGELHEIILTAIDDAARDAFEQNNTRQVALVQAAREKFIQHRTLAGWLNERTRKNYLSRMSKSCNSLSSLWEREIERQRRSGNEELALALEKELGEALVHARGYGLALPPLRELATRRFRLRNVGTNLVLGVNDNESLILQPMIPPRRRQVFQFLLFEETVAIKNVDRSKVLNIPNSTNAPNTRIILFSRDGSGANEKWKLIEEGRRLIISSAMNDLSLAFGTNIIESEQIIVQATAEDSAMQRWVLEPAF